MTRPTDFSYSGTELEAVAEAKNYYQWVVEDLAGSLEANSVIAVNVPDHVERTQISLPHAQHWHPVEVSWKPGGPA